STKHGKRAADIARNLRGLCSQPCPDLLHCQTEFHDLVELLLIRQRFIDTHPARLENNSLVNDFARMGNLLLARGDRDWVVTVGPKSRRAKRKNRSKRSQKSRELASAHRFVPLQIYFHLSAHSFPPKEFLSFSSLLAPASKHVPKICS